MRISDWSSDVCSSDLKALPAVLRFAAAPPQSLGVQVRFARRLSSPAKAAKGAANRKGVTMKTDNPLPEHEPEHAESSTAYLPQEMADRKSGVKGKSVSVRVALGVRRKIKKKKLKTN